MELYFSLQDGSGVVTRCNGGVFRKTNDWKFPFIDIDLFCQFTAGFPLFSLEISFEIIISVSNGRESYYPQMFILSTLT